MLGAVFMALVGLSLTVAGLVALAWWLWRLWEQQEKDATAQAIEIKPAPSPFKTETPPTEAEVEVPENEAETSEPAAEATAAATAVVAVDKGTRAVEADVEAPTPEAEPPVEEVAVAATADILETPAVEADVEAPEAEVEVAAEAPAAPAKPDDLKRIEGIGPKIASVLQAGGISTYAQLADSDPDQLRQILEESDPRLIRIANPDTWPEQASLVAAGDTDGLEELKAALKGGRRA